MGKLDYKQNTINVDGLKVENTQHGWMLKVRKGAQWLGSILYGNEINDKNVFIPKVWVDIGITKNAATSTVVNLPNFIKPQDVVSISLMVNLGLNHLHCWAWDTVKGVASDHDDTNRIEVSYEAATNKVHFLNLGSSSGNGARGKNYRLAVFFK